MTPQILKIHKLVEHIDSELQNVIIVCTIGLYLCTVWFLFLRCTCLRATQALAIAMVLVAIATFL